MELTKNFDHTTAEQKWYQHWMEKGYFFSKPDDREPYTVVIPPPNVTGVLHMGHCLNNTIQDILVRRARMLGKNVCWVPGTDHASIATEAKVVAMLRERDIKKSSISRDEFLGYAWEWKEKYGGIILQQLKKLGCSLDWNRTCFTMDPDYYQSVIKVFIDLYNKGYIYRGKRMINWDVKAKTALSDEEVIFKEVNSKLYFLRYQLADENGNPIPFFPSGPSERQLDRIALAGVIRAEDVGITIATVRPETILGDTAICVNPNDERYKHLHGRFAFVPLINRRIPIITDEYVTMEFGTGALKVTPAHDSNDYQLGQKHKLEVVDIMNDDGTMSEAAQLYVGEDRFEARKKIVKELEEKGHLVKTEDYANQIGFSERTDAVVEPRLSLQWWVDMKNLSAPALDTVMNDEIKFFPPKFKNLYRHWMKNIKDWCISRQLWWGHRIPAWYDEEGNVYVAINEKEALEMWAKQRGTTPLTGEPARMARSDGAGSKALLWRRKGPLFQDEDCLDTWFSSWLWPMEVFKGISNPGNADINYYYPTSVLVTGQDIIFFWVARMIMSGMEYNKQIPFKHVYFTGMVRDKQGRKMSKSLGNSPDLLELIDKYGADAVRFAIMISSPAGNDLLFDETALEQGRNFNNKIWNALKLVKMWEGRQLAVSSNKLAESNFAISWFGNRLYEVRAEVNALMNQFRLSEALKTIYSLIWDDFCNWYLEWVKPGFEQPIDAAVYNKTIFYFEELMQLLHPYMPFVTEEIYHLLKTQTDDLCIKQFAAVKSVDESILKYGEILKSDITAIRDVRGKNEIKNSEQIKFMNNSSGDLFYGQNNALFNLLQKQTNLIYYPGQLVSNIQEYSKNEVIARSGDRTFFLHLEKQVDKSAQKESLLKDLEHQKGFLVSVEKKLTNEKFVANAKPEVIKIERKKKSDAEAKIKAIEESLAGL